MIRISALNEDSSEESEEEDVPTVTREALEEQSLAKYKQALELQRDNKLQEAEDILQDLLDTKLLQEVQKSDVIQGVVPPTLSLKYSCLKNVGVLELKKGCEGEALEFFLQALELDDTDVSLWFKTGCVAEKLQNYNLAATAFYQGLQCSPTHWPCLDHLISILFALNDYITCLLYVSRGLRRDAQFTKGLALRDAMLRESPSLQQHYKEIFPHDPLPPGGSADESQAQEILEEALHMRRCRSEAGKEPPRVPLGLSKPLGLSWLELGEEILSLYHFIDHSDPCISVGHPIDLDSVRPDLHNVTPGDESMEVEGTPPQQKPQTTEEQQEDCDSGKRIPRRRMFLESWVLGGQRRSARVRTTARRDTEDVTLGESLRRLIPLSLLPESTKEGGIRSSDDNSMDTMDMFKLFERQEGETGTVTSRRTSANSQVDVEEVIKKEDYFGTEREKGDIEKYIAEHRDNWGINNLLIGFVQSLSKFEGLTWPNKLIPLYLECYDLMRRSVQHPCPIGDEYELNDLKIDGEISLLHGELFMDRKLPMKRNTKDMNENITYNKIMEDVGQLIFLSVNENLFKDNFLVRVYWLRANVAIQNCDSHEACVNLKNVLDCLEKFPDGVVIPNCKNNGIITTEVVEKLLTTLERSQSLSGVEQLWEEQRWEELATVLEASFQVQHLTSSTTQRSIEGLDRSTQIEMFLDALVRLENQFKRCFYWIEVSLNEALNKYLSALEDVEQQQKWAKVIEKLLSGFIYCIEENDNKIIGTLTNVRISRLVQNLSHIICHQLEASESIIEMPIESIDPWILLQQILAYEEDKKKNNDEIRSTASSDDSHRDGDIPGSLMLLFTAHEHLGKRSWCCLNEGALLLHAMDEIIPKLRSEEFAPFRNKLTPYIEQIIYCLYAYPNKRIKGKYFQEHSVPQITLTFERAQQILEFYRPDELPEFDSYRLGSISVDAESLFKRILALAPADCEPGTFVDDMKNYIYGERLDLPKATHSPLPPGVADINYLLGDYYFKNSDLPKAIHYYLLDVCHNPDRLDSWAGMALARGSQLETQLNSCDSIESEVEFLKQANAAEKCYQRTLELDNFHGLIWIEFGSFVYMIHSFCSRLLKQESDKLSLEQFELLEQKKESTLNLAEGCFKKASQLWTDLGEESGQQDERWLHHYMLGKIIEKREDDPIKAIIQYQKAAEFLYENNATYPSKINYTNPPEYSIEALEVHYRIHACILKYLEANEGKKLDEKYENFFKKTLSSEQKGPFMLGQSKSELEAEKTEFEPGESRKRKASNDSSNDSISKKERFDSTNDINNIMSNLLDQVDVSHNQESTKNATKTIMEGSELKIPSNACDNRVENTEKITAVTENKASESPQRRASQESTTTITSTTTTTSSTDSSSDSSSSSSSSSSSDSSDSSDSETDTKQPEQETTKQPETVVEPKEKALEFDPKIDHRSLVQVCLSALETCVLRFPEHYKALFRLAHFHFRSRTQRDVTKCRDLLLGPENPATSTTALHALFQDRKPSNFFNGVWRIPVNEIDRPGCFASHMSRCVLLTMDLVRELRDHATLLDLCLQLRKAPEADKKYLRDSEREQLSRQAVLLAVQALRTKFREMKPADERLPALMVDVYRALQKVQRQVQNREAAFNKLLSDAFAMYKFGKLETELPILEPALKFAQQELVRLRSLSQGGSPALSVTPLGTPTLPAATSTPVSSPASAATTPTNLSTGATSRRQTPSGNSRRGRPPLSRPTPSPRHTTPTSSFPSSPFSGNSSRGRPRGRPPAPSFFPNMYTDPSFLTAAVQAQIPSLDYYFKMEGFQNQFLRHMMPSYPGLSQAALSQMASASMSQQASALSQSLQASALAQLANQNLQQQALSQLSTQGLSQHTLSQLTSQNLSQQSLSQMMSPNLSQYNPTAQQVAKDRPNLSVTAINPSMSSNKPRSSTSVSKKVRTDKVKSRPPKLPSSTITSSSQLQTRPVPTKAKLKGKIPTPPMVSSPIPSGSRSSPVPSPIRRASPIPSHLQRSSPIPGMKRSSPISQMRRSSPIPSQSRKSSPVPSQARKSSPVPSHVRRSSPVPSHVRRSSPIPPPMMRHAPIANPAPSVIQQSPPMISRGPPTLTPRPSTYIAPPQAHMNPSLDRIGRDIIVTHTLPKVPRMEAPKSMNLPLNLPSSITITPKSQSQKSNLDMTKDAISIEQVPTKSTTSKPSTETKSKPEKPKSGPEIITLE